MPAIPSALGVIGECMLEISQHGDSYTLGYGGDVFNTAVYASRFGIDVKFISAIGDDHYSQYLMDAWRNEGVGTETVRIISGLAPSLYIINTDETGERTFHYWRDSSPFKKLLVPGVYLEDLPDTLKSCQCIYFSGITLGLLSDSDRTLLLDLLKSYQGAGGTVAFDSNYRPRLWTSSEEAQVWIDRAYTISDIAFPSFDDEALLRADHSHDNLLERIQSFGVKEIILKDGAKGATLSIDGKIHSVVADSIEQASVIDTTAAGDSFNGAYLATRLKGSEAIASAEIGCKVAAKIIQHRGAIIPNHVTLEA